MKFLESYFVIVTGSEDERYVIVDNNGHYDLCSLIPCDLRFEKLSDAYKLLLDINNSNMFDFTTLRIVQVSSNIVPL